MGRQVGVQSSPASLRSTIFDFDSGRQTLHSELVTMQKDSAIWVDSRKFLVRFTLNSVIQASFHHHTYEASFSFVIF